MAHSYRELLALSDEDLIDAHDSLAPSTITGVNYFLDELRRRTADRQTDQMVRLTEAITTLTRVVVLLTALSVVFSAANLVVALLE